MTDDTTTPDPVDELGDAGKKAIKAERDRAAAAERQLRALQAQLDEATSRATSLEASNGDLAKQVTERELANTRLTVGLDKGLSKVWIDRLKGTTPEEIAADADEILQSLPQPAAAGSTNPKPDPSQGARGPGQQTPADQFAASVGSLFTT
jgi:uncharacterized phage infection (PIP) family protein YhgE